MSIYKKNQSIEKGLAILSYVCQSPGQTRSDIAKQTSINRTTVYRLLETLEDIGYLRRGAFDDSYYPSSNTLLLNAEADVNCQLLDAASPCLRALNNSIEWPASIIVHDDGQMVIRDTTHGRSKKYVHKVGLGTKVPILTSAAGHVYLSYCTEKNRQQILSRLKKDEAVGKTKLTKTLLERIFATTRKQGYAICLGEAEFFLNGIAMPIRYTDTVIASMNIVFLSGCVKEREAKQLYLPILKETVIQIEQKLSTSTGIK